MSDLAGSGCSVAVTFESRDPGKCRGHSASSVVVSMAALWSPGLDFNRTTPASVIRRVLRTSNSSGHERPLAKLIDVALNGFSGLIRAQIRPRRFGRCLRRPLIAIPKAVRFLTHTLTV